MTTFPDNKARATHKTFSSEESDSSEDDVRLSRGFILAHMHVDDPLDVVEMNITGCDLEDVRGLLHCIELSSLALLAVQYLVA